MKTDQSYQSSSLNNIIQSTSVETIDPMLLIVRSSPLTTVSSCGAVEDFDENFSVHHTETLLNDDDEFASIASITSLKNMLSSSSQNRFNVSVIAAKNASELSSPVSTFVNKVTIRNPSKSPSRSGVQLTSPLVSGTETRTATPRSLRRRTSKSPDSSTAEENYEGLNVLHTTC